MTWFWVRIMAFSSSSTGRLPAKATKRGSFGPGAGASPSSSYSSVQSVASVSSRSFGTKKKTTPPPPPPPPNVANVNASIGMMKSNYRPGTKADLKGKENHHDHASHLPRVPIDLTPTPFITCGGSVGGASGPPTVVGSLPPPPPPEPAKVGLPSPTPRNRAQVTTPSTSAGAPTSASTSASTSPLSSSATCTPAVVAGISGSDATPSQPSVSSSSPSVNNVLFEFGPKTFLTGGALGGVDDDCPSSPPRSRSGPSAPILGGSGSGGSGKAAAVAGKKGDTRKTQKNTAGASGHQGDVNKNASAATAVEQQQQQLQLEMAAALERAVNAGDPHAALRLADEAWTRVIDGMLAAPDKEKITLVPLVAALMANVASAFDSLRCVQKNTTAGGETARTQLCASSSSSSLQEEQEERLQLLAAPRRTASGGYISSYSVGASRSNLTGRRFSLGPTMPWLFALGGAGTGAARLQN